MSGQRSADSEGAAESVAAGCCLSESPSRSSRNKRKSSQPDLDGLACFTWGRGEDGQLGLGGMCMLFYVMYMQICICARMYMRPFAIVNAKYHCVAAEIEVQCYIEGAGGFVTD